MTIPPLPHLIAWTAGALGVAALVRFVVKEHRRVNEELERVRATPLNARERAQLRVLRRDRDGIYRPRD
jgi:hypothetical protein